MNCEHVRDLHDPFLDGELAPLERAAVEAHLSHCASCGARDDQGRALKAAIRGTARRYAAPPLLAARVRRDLGHTTASRWRNLRYLSVGWNPVAIAASLLLTIATSIGVTASYLSPAPEEQVVQDLVASHVRSLMGEHLVDIASTDQRTVRPFLAGKVEVEPPTIDMASTGFSLVGARLDYVADHRCAALVYRHDKHVINVMVWARGAEDEDATESYQRQGYNLIHMTEDNLDYWAVSDLDRGELGGFMNHLMTATQAADTQT